MLFSQSRCVAGASCHRVDEALQHDVVFIPFAYVEAAANVLTNPKFDPLAKIPEFKVCAVKVEKAPPIAAE